MGAASTTCACETRACRCAGVEALCNQCADRSSKGCRDCTSTSEWNPADPGRLQDDPSSSLPRAFLHHPWAQVEELDGRSPSIAPEASSPSKPAHCRLRIIFVSDVYVLDNLPALKTLVNTESAGFPATNVVTALPGDFLAPSLLSSLDGGYSMVKSLNHVPIDLVCFGNHDGNDIPYGKLVHRIEEFNGHWLNSNMPDFEPELPANKFHSLTGEDGTVGARTVAFLGFMIGGEKFKSMFRPEAFGGAHKSMIPVIEAAQGAVDACHQQYTGLDECIPLTHQDMAEDRILADMGLFPVILGGHDHDQMSEVSEKTGCRVVKPGMDATHAAIVDLVWYSSEPQAKPVVNVHFKAVSDFKADPELADLVDKAHIPVRELESATLYVVPEGEALSSVRARFQDCSLARMMATAVRDCLGCDGVIINSGTVRGNREYVDGISYGDIKRECPFSSVIIVVTMPYSVLKEGVRLSRQKWWDLEEGHVRKEAASALQTDEGMDLVDHVPVSIRGKQDIDDDELFRIGCDTYVLGRNVIFREYCQNFPEHIPPHDAGRPLLPILVEYFCAMLWTQLIDAASDQVMSEASISNFKRRAANDSPDIDMGVTQSAVGFSNSVHKIFELFDQDRDGSITAVELQRVLSQALGTKLSSRIVVQQLLHMVGANSDGSITEPELRQAIRKMALSD